MKSNGVDKVVFKTREDKAKSLVYNVAEAIFSPKINFTPEQVHLVWFSKVLKNWKALVFIEALDAEYFEVTYNGDKGETYIDVYTKVENVMVVD